MSTENAAEHHTTADKEEAVVEMNWQSGDSDNNGSDNSGSYENPENELGYLLQKGGGLEKVQMNETPIIFLRKRYGSVVVHINCNNCCMRYIKSPYSICRLVNLSKM
jgi:hypothetical protein